MSDHVWVFERAGERLEIRRASDQDGLKLVIVRADERRAYAFAELEELINFQCDMEAMLIGTGWSFLEFSPERRSGRDRRSWPRLTDRRRWWTDGVHLVAPAAKRVRRRR